MASNEIDQDDDRTALDGPRPRLDGLERLHDVAMVLDDVRTVLDDVSTATAVALDDVRTAVENGHGSTAHLEFYVPSTGKDGSVIPQVEFSRRTEQIAVLFCGLFRGCTVYPTLGYWLDDDGRMIHERINVVKTATDPALLLGNIRRIHDVATSNGRLWYQHTMMLDVNGSTIMIDI